MTTNTKLFGMFIPALYIAIYEDIWWYGGPTILHEKDEITALLNATFA